ncbi:MAG: DUF5067 domain-containing protein [Eubacterium sp.]|nr:DUF5067 domain-containing protein [Eubacterium sp.]
MDNNMQNEAFQPQNGMQPQQQPQQPKTMEGRVSGMSITALILSIIGCTGVVGLILAIIDVTKKDGRKKVLSIIALVICAIWAVIGIVMGMVTKRAAKEVTSAIEEELSTEFTFDVTTEEEKEDTTEAEKDTEAEPEESEYYFKDMEVVTEDYTIKITDWKIIQQGEAGNEYGSSPVIAFWYDTTNTSGNSIDPMSAWIYIMEAYQDNDPNAVNDLSVGMLPDSQFTESQMQDIKKDGTVQNAMAYELSDTETPVVLTAKASMIGKEIDSMEFDIVNMSAKNSDGVSATGGNTDSKEKSEKAEPSFEDGVIVTNDYTMTITDYKIIQPGEEGNKYGKSPVIAFWYDTTNTSGKKVNPSTAWIYIMEVVQDNDSNAVNKLSVGMLPDDQFTSTQLQDIKEGGTVANAVAYELTDDSTPVTLIAKNGMLGKEIGQQTFEIK